MQKAGKTKNFRQSLILIMGFYFIIGQFGLEMENSE